ncbi:hypothetical protein EDD22DRAFT_848815 [Suillus occidentalis]|nr:hypothetical protein EDD22DRAFT_848815 [Suillus occidentalis]
MPAPLRVKRYQAHDLNFEELACRAQHDLDQWPFDWQLEAAAAVMEGYDVVLDVGTGCGKTLCFLLLLLQNEQDIRLVISPLMALMIDQAEHASLSSVAVCSEVIAKVGRDRLFKVYNLQFLSTPLCVMKFADESKADLRFVVPHGATLANDIPTQLIYCNDRTTTEDIVDKLRGWLPSHIPWSCIAFYHAKIGTKHKCQIEEKLRSDAVSMGCDMQNIQRVILWGLPPSFCALVQWAGCAA